MMIATILAALLVCSGAAPRVIGAELQSKTLNGHLDRYVVAVHVKNLGTQGQPSNRLQSVEVFQNGDHVDQKGVPPLRVGQTATVRYTFDRSADAAAHTTRLAFSLNMHGQDGECSVAAQPFRLSV